MSRFSPAIVLAPAAFALLCMTASAPPVRADEAGLTSGHVLACDTADEVEAVLKAGDLNLPASLASVNERFGSQSCNVVTAIFYRGDQDRTVLVPDGIVRIIKVDMVGYRSGNAWMRMTRPLSQYVGVLEDATRV
jgi:hypothetical protein